MLKKVCTLFSLLLLFSFCMTLIGEESANIYFPHTLDSFWVYEDQDGNELTRQAIEGEEIAGETFYAFSFDPELEDWADYNPFIFSALYQVNDAGIILVVNEEVENAFEVRLTNEMNAFVDIIKSQIPAGVDASLFDLGIEVEAEAEDLMFLLPDTITFDEEWDVNQIEAQFKMTPRGPDVPEGDQLTIDYTVMETGIILGTEDVETEAGTFEDCLKVEYRTETTAVMTPDPPPGEVAPPGETVTTVWFARNVGIVKLHQIAGNIFLDMIPEDAGLPGVLPPHKERTLELKQYEIKTAETKSDSSD